LAELILVIDHFDSFVHNLVHQLARVVPHCPVNIIRCDKVLPKDAEKAELIVFSPGPCTPLETGGSWAVINHWKSDIPMLGVCLGHQLLANFLGAKINRSLSPLHGLVSCIEHNGSWPFKGIPKNFYAARYHSLAVVPENHYFDTCAWLENGEPMAILREEDKAFQLGVQFHPESFLTLEGDLLIKNVCAQAGII
tara:strand:+ start:124 stop:708 length:585 start_codon:yes stop_codon:yes gene_type:complete